MACGGDGTLFDIVNGMLHRSDKKRLPVTILPNGTANEISQTFHHSTLEKSLDYLIKGDIVKMDIFKVLIDHEKEEDISEEDKNKFL